MYRAKIVITYFLLTVPLVALAAPRFPDVPDSHPYAKAIEDLVSANVINGNPDGNFYPEKTVNRAEMIKMLYLTAHISPSSLAKDCFTDVAKGSWYENYVCDAAQRGYVAGYGDKTFKPAQAVNRVEALKMMFTILGIPSDVPPAGTSMRYTDVPLSSWYARYVYSALQKGLLPLPGQDATTLMPDAALSRGEAAALIDAAWKYLYGEDAESSSSVSSASSSVSSRSSSSESSSSPAQVQEESFPFADDGQFPGKKSSSYTFTLGAKTTLMIDADITGAITSTLSCRLYLLREDGFSEEYYLGIEDGRSCVIRATVPKGNYQLQLMPSASNAYYSVAATTATGDGNDGMSEAIKLTQGKARTGILDPHDLYDWYSFTLSADTTATILFSPITNADCTIYTPITIDQFGFDGPECNASFTFHAGTYFVAVTRHLPLETTQPYTISLQK